jgi:hypothetical protein
MNEHKVVVRDYNNNDLDAGDDGALFVKENELYKYGKFGGGFQTVEFTPKNNI